MTKPKQTTFLIREAEVTIRSLNEIFEDEEAVIRVDEKQQITVTVDWTATSMGLDAEDIRGLIADIVERAGLRRVLVDLINE